MSHSHIFIYLLSCFVLFYFPTKTETHFLHLKTAAWATWSAHKLLSSERKCPCSRTCAVHMGRWKWLCNGIQNTAFLFQNIPPSRIWHSFTWKTLSGILSPLQQLDFKRYNLLRHFRKSLSIYLHHYVVK